MLAIPPTTQPALPLISTIARLLSSDRSFAARIHDLFVLLREAVVFHDGRLVCWLQSAHTSGLREQFYTPNGWPDAWNDDLTRQVVQHGAAVRLTAPVRVLLNGDIPDPPAEVTYFGVPVTWNGRLWGVLELRAAGSGAIGDPEQGFVAALLPLLAAAIAVEGGAGAVATLPLHAGELTGQQEQIITMLRAELEAPLSLNELLTLLLHWALDSTGAEAGAINLVDHDRGEMVLHVYEGYDQEPFATGDLYSAPRRRLSWENGIAGKVARTGRSILLRDVTREPDYQPGSPDVRAELAVPIALESQVLAVLVLDSPRSAAFGDGEVAFAQALCALAPQPLRRALRYQELLESSTQLSQVITSMPIGLALLDVHGRILRHNPAWPAVWGVGPVDGDMAFQLPWDLVPLLLARLTDPMALNDFCAHGQGNPNDIQTTTIRLRDPHQELDVLSVPTRDSLGQLTGRLWLVSDVTREREADRLKSEFISVVSHELRTPLTSILGYTELLLARDFAPAEQREFVKTVYNEANHLSQIVEDMLGISRLEAGNVKLNQWVVSMRQLIGEMTAQLSHHLSARHRMVIHIPNHLPPAYVDRDKVKQVLFNLLINAAKYSPRGGEIALSVEEVSELPEEHPQGRFLLVAVRDQGIGIPPEDLPRIWERFYRVDNTNTRRIGGTGLGLAITRALVELHGGRIWVESALGKGSAFFFTLPVVVDIARAPKLPEQ
jgi:signal transduction histidine kinase/GAF domain-containing protein